MARAGNDRLLSATYEGICGPKSLKNFISGRFFLSNGISLDTVLQKAKS